MNVIVPLAGPDFIHHDGSIKGLMSLHGDPIIKYALDTRPWASAIKHYSFVLYDCQAAREFAEIYLREWYNDCSIVFVTKYSRGAALSAIAGISTLSNFLEPLVIDLADIIFKSSVNIHSLFQNRPKVDGIAQVFQSDNSRYSYLACDKSGFFIEAAEKKVISNHASTGTYIFRHCGSFLLALSHAFQNEASQTYRGLFYVCPLFNGILAQGKQVLLEPVFDVFDIKSL